MTKMAHSVAVGVCTFPSTFSQLNKVKKNPVRSEEGHAGSVVVVQGYLPLSKKTPESSKERQVIKL